LKNLDCAVRLFIDKSHRGVPLSPFTRSASKVSTHFVADAHRSDGKRVVACV
jgi:hypothetical protein